MAPRRFYLHVGLAKSGTTYLQDVLFASQDALAAQGVALVPPRRAGHFRLAVDVVGAARPEDGAAITQARRRFRRQLQELRCDVGIFTHELMAPASVEAISELVGLLDGFEVHVVVTVRDLARTLASSWQQNIKQRHLSTQREFLRDAEVGGPRAGFFTAAQSLPGVLARWSQVVPAERVHVVVVPPSGTPPEVLLQRFCEALDLDAASLAVPESRGNPSLGNAPAELLRRVNVALGDRLPHPRDGYRAVGKRWLAETVLAGQRQSRPRLPADAAPWVGRASDDWVRHVRGSGVRVHGDLRELAPDVSVFAADDAVVPADAELLEVAVTALADVLAGRHHEQQQARAAAPSEATRRPPATAPGRGLRRTAHRLLRGRRPGVSDR